MSKTNHKQNQFKRICLTCVTLLTLQVGIANAEVLDSLTVHGSLFSEPLHLGLSESHGHPGVALSLDLELGNHFYIGANGYRATDSRPPNRSENYNLYIGTHWGKQDKTQFDIALIHRSYPGDFPINWDYTELQFDTHFTENFALSLTGSIDYYGLDEANSLGITGSYVHDFSDNLFAKIEGGTLRLDGKNLDSYEFAILGGGYRFDRLSFEILYRTNNAEENRAFKRPQIRDGFIANLNWLIY
ncbi:MAG: hypothetical protein ACR2PU_04910 [Gammaproteobacteria bacterium]